MPIVALCSAALFAPLLVPLLQGRVFTENDLITYYIPTRYLYSEALRAGDSVLWSPAMYSGIYAFGEGPGGMAHPLHFVLFRYLPLSLAINLEIISGYIAALVGCRMLLGRLGLSRESSWFGGMVFAFSGFNLLRLIHINAVEIIGHLPWILLGVHVLLTSGNGRARAGAFAGTAALIGSQLLLGYPQYVWLTMLAVGYLSACLLIDGVPRRRVLLLGGAVISGALIGAVQVLPTLDLVSTSLRSDPTLHFRLTFSLNPLNLIQAFSPYAFEQRVYAHPGAFQIHESSMYNGAFCTIAVAWLAIRYRALERRRLAVALVGLAAISLLFALGRYGGVYVLMTQLPGVSLFRAPARHVLLLHLALSGIAALAFEDILRLVRQRATIEWRQLRFISAPLLLSVAITGIAAALSQSTWARGHNLMFSSLAYAGLGSGLFALTTALLVMASRGVRASVPLMVIVTALDLGSWGYLYVYRGPPRTIDELAAVAEVPPQAQPGDLIEPIKTGLNLQNLGVLRDLKLSTGYMALVPASVLDPNDPLTQRLAGVKWRWNGTDWFEVADRMPRVRLLASAERSDDIARDVRRVDVSRTALTDQSIGELSGAPGQAVFIVDRPGRLVVKTTAAGRQLLVVTERFHRGWRATEDGRECRPLPVYGDFLGCVVSPGTHEVTFTFAPDSLQNGLRLTLTGLASTLGLAVLMWRRASARVTLPVEGSLRSG